MKKAKYSDKDLVVSILIEAFGDNPNIQWIVGSTPKNREAKLKRFFEFAVELTFLQGEIGIADNHKGVILYFQEPKRSISLKTVWLNLRFILQVAGFRKLPDLIKREKYCKTIRQSNKQFIYVWFIGAVAHEQNATIVDLKNSIFKKSVEENLPIYIETTVPKARLAYVRYGFKVFHEWNNLSNHLTTWFLKREPSTFGLTF
ncbi:MAG: hypothetical protein JNL70_16280 [Saprospiraceae bacterium]|nr:hypothetical protein [Saprospiraceae bacterium]